jgi:hypothetical protein
VRCSVGQQGRQWADSSRQRSGIHSGRWADAAHLFRPKLAPNRKMLPSRRRRAGRFSRSRRWSALHSSSVCSGHRGPSFYAQVGPQGLRKHSERCRSSRPAPCGERSSHGWLRGRSNFGLNPLRSGPVGGPDPAAPARPARVPSSVALRDVRGLTERAGMAYAITRTRGNTVHLQVHLSEVRSVRPRASRTGWAHTGGLAKWRRNI